MNIRNPSASKARWEAELGESPEADRQLAQDKGNDKERLLSQAGARQGPKPDMVLHVWSCTHMNRHRYVHRKTYHIDRHNTHRGGGRRREGEGGKETLLGVQLEKEIVSLML